jgi:hypothetical protein
VIDEAILNELGQRYLDLEETRERLRARSASDAALAAEALAQAERDLMRAEDALERIRSDYKAGEITAAEWRELRGELTGEQEAAKAAVRRAKGHTTEVAGDNDCEVETLRQLAELRATVLGGVESAPSLNALRRMVAQLFASVVYRPAERWGEALVIPGTDAGCNVAHHAYAGQAVLVPVLRQQAIGGYIGNPLETNLDYR